MNKTINTNNNTDHRKPSAVVTPTQLDEWPTQLDEWPTQLDEWPTQLVTDSNTPSWSHMNTAPLEEMTATADYQ